MIIEKIFYSFDYLSTVTFCINSFTIGYCKSYRHNSFYYFRNPNQKFTICVDYVKCSLLSIIYIKRCNRLTFNSKKCDFKKI